MPKLKPKCSGCKGTRLTKENRKCFLCKGTGIQGGEKIHKPESNPGLHWTPQPVQWIVDRSRDSLQPWNRLGAAGPFQTEEEALEVNVPDEEGMYRKMYILRINPDLSQDVMYQWDPQLKAWKSY